MSLLHQAIQVFAGEKSNAQNQITGYAFQPLHGPISIISHGQALLVSQDQIQPIHLTKFIAYFSITALSL